MTVLTEAEQDEIEARQPPLFEAEEDANLSFVAAGRGLGLAADGDGVDVPLGDGHVPQELGLDHPQVARRMIGRDEPLVGLEDVGPLPRQVAAGRGQALVERDRRLAAG